MRVLAFLLLSLMWFSQPFAAVADEQHSKRSQRPNILWISVEDISSHLGCYGDPHAITPNLDAFAEQSVRYTQAFTCHGVCAPSRTGIITGMYPHQIGANHMRSKTTLPDHVRCFPEYLKQAGYYCTNNSKTDYNFAWDQSKVWDETSRKAHWKNRSSADQPFFAVFNLTTTHESRIWRKNWQQVIRNLPAELRHDGRDIRVPRLYPQTTEVQDAMARLFDLITVMDQQVGDYLTELQDAGLSENTIVFFWSDHGNGFPRAKRWVYDSGTLVPLMVRIPESLRTSGQGQPGSVDDQLINLIDLGPTVLNLANVAVPDYVQGRPFLGESLPEPRQYVFAARDRVDERFDMVRSVRDAQFRYVKTLNPWRPALQHINYSENSVVRKEMRRLAAIDQLAPESAQFLQQPRPFEELYDTKNDPWELKNLAADPAYADQLQRLANKCREWQRKAADAHLIPESILDEEGKAAGSRWAVVNSESGQSRVNRLSQIAETAASATSDDLGKLLLAAADSDPAARWWAMHGLANLNASDAKSLAAIRQASQDTNAGVRIAAGRALHAAGMTPQALQILTAELQNTSVFVRHAAVNELDEMGTAAAPAKDAISKLSDEGEYVGNVVRHALQQLGGASADNN